ncbi:hypothetical protein N0Y54_15535 [Nostoc punctiforme UO1]|uniref:hypothetical protein n=1 Tax=Nostoc punctiforme TaxID=272131 RepID=UPI0030985A7C
MGINPGCYLYDLVDPPRFLLLFGDVIFFPNSAGSLEGADDEFCDVRSLGPSVSSGHGYTAIIAACIGRLNPSGIILCSLFMALL